MHWLQFAAVRHVPAAEAFIDKLCLAMTAPDLAAYSMSASIDQQRRSLSQSSSKNAIVETIDEQESDEATQNKKVPQGVSIQVPDIDDLEAVTAGYNQIDSADESDRSSTIKGETKARLSDEVISAILEDDVPTLRQCVSSKPGCLMLRDKDGATALLLAVKFGKFAALDFLLDQDTTDASIRNLSKESPLHLLSPFADEQIKLLVPRLVSKGADIFAEALPTKHGKDMLDFSTKVRCCPILRSVLSDNLTLLNCLLEEAHKDRPGAGCRICETGCRFRRVVTIALSTFRAQALSIILDHVKAHQESERIDLSKIEVWSNKQLLPLWKVPFQSMIITTIDLPESFFRAINYGTKYKDALQSTLALLLDNVCQKVQQLYEMLQESVAVDSLDAVRLLLSEGQKRGLKPYWWLMRSVKDFATSPLVLAIRQGKRAIFECLYNAISDIFQHSIPVQIPRRTSLLGDLLDSLDDYYRTRYLNVAQICLSLAVTAAHKDQYFL